MSEMCWREMEAMGWNSSQASKVFQEETENEVNGYLDETAIPTTLFVQVDDLNRKIQELQKENYRLENRVREEVRKSDNLREIERELKKEKNELYAEMERLISEKLELEIKYETIKLALKEVL